MSVLGVIITIAIVIGLAIVGAFVVKKLRLVNYYKELAEDEKDKTK